MIVKIFELYLPCTKARLALCSTSYLECSDSTQWIGIPVNSMSYVMLGKANDVTKNHEFYN